MPLKLLANLLAPHAATATSKPEGRLAREADIRDAFHLTPPGEARGLDGDLLSFWREAVRVRTSGAGEIADIIGADFFSELGLWLDVGQEHAWTHGPMAGSVAVLPAVLEFDDRAERAACLLSDIVVTRALNWTSVLPLTAQHLTKTMLRNLVPDGQDAGLKVQARLLTSIEDTIRLAQDLALRAALLQAVAPKLRAKGSEAAVALFLSEDAIDPSTMLSPTN